MDANLGTDAGIQALQTLCKTENMWEGIHAEMDKLLADAKRKSSDSCLQDIQSEEKDALETLASKANQDSKLLPNLPQALGQQLLETNCALLRRVIHPLVARIVEAMRRDPECRRSAWSVEGADFDNNYNPNTCWAAASWHPGSVRPLKHPDLKKLLEVIGGRAGIYKQVLQYLKELSSQNAVLPVLRLDDANSEGMPVSRGPEPFLRSVRSSLILAAVKDGILLKSILGWWSVEAAWQNNERKINYKICLEAGSAGVTSGSSQLPGVREVTWELQGSRLKILQKTLTQVFSCNCDVSEDRKRWMNGTWESRSAGSNGSKEFQGTFAASKVGSLRYADARLEEWDELADFVVTCADMSEGPIRSSDSCDIHAVVSNLIQERADEPQEAVREFAADMTWLTADPWIWQLLLFILMIWSACHPSRRQGFPTSVAAALYMLHCSAACLEGRKCNDIHRIPLTEAEFAEMGLSIPDITAALHSIAKQKVFPKEHGESGLCMSYLCHDKSGDESFRPALERAMQHAGGQASAVTTLRLLLAAMAGQACYLRKSERLKVCMELAPKWHVGTGSDWVEQLFVDWLMNTTWHRHWKLEPYLYEPLVEGFLKMAARDAMIHFRLLVFLEVWSRATHCGQIRREYLEKCFQEDIPSEARCQDDHYAWKEHLASLYYVNSYKMEPGPEPATLPLLSAAPLTALERNFPSEYLRECYEKKLLEDPPSKSAAVFLQREHEWSVEVPNLPAPPKKPRRMVPKPPGNP